MNSLRRVASLRLRSYSTAPLTAILPVDAAYTDGLRTGGSMYELSMQKVSREGGRAPVITLWRYDRGGGGCGSPSLF